MAEDAFRRNKFDVIVNFRVYQSEFYTPSYNCQATLFSLYYTP